MKPNYEKKNAPKPLTAGPALPPYLELQIALDIHVDVRRP